MGGKRPDQHNIDPAEGRTTDHKFMPQSGHGGGDATQQREGDKQRLADTKAGEQPFLPDIPSPSVHANHGVKTQDQESAGDEESA